MKKRVLFLTLLSLPLILTGCENANDSSSSSSDSLPSSSSSEAPSSSSPDISFDGWNKEEKRLMETYCGAILPYPIDLLSGEIKLMEQINSSNKQKYLAIVNQSDAFTLKEYYKVLERYGWTTIKDHKGNKVQYRSGTPYVELTNNSSDGSKGYDITYYHAELDLEGNGEKAYYNCLIAYNFYSATPRKDLDWSDEDKEVIEYVATIDLPYIALGEKYSITVTDENTLFIYDYYTKDLSEEYIKILENDGYIKSSVLSNKNNAYVLVKSLSDGSSLNIVIDYYNGNNIYVYFNPKVTSYTAWPTEVVSPKEKESGVQIPEFKVAEGGYYNCFERHGTTYIITYDLDSSFDYENYIYSVRSELYNWGETLNINAYILSDSEMNDVGFYLSFKVSTPTSTFSSSWPKEGIIDGLKDSIGVEGVEIPSLDLNSIDSPKDLKYVIKDQSDYDAYYEYYLNLLTEEYSDILNGEQIEELAKEYADERVKKGVTVSIYDPQCEIQKDSVTRYEANEAYKNALYEAGWYKVPDSWGNKYEDPSGKILIEVANTPDSYTDCEYGCTEISIIEGSGIAHTPQFEFGKESYSLATGAKLSLDLNINMLPYEVTYSIDDTTGDISITNEGVLSASIDATVGQIVTVTASLKDKNGKEYKTSCKVTVEKGITYKSVLEDIEEILAKKGYSGFSKEDIVTPGKKVVGEKLTVNLGTSLTKEEVKDMVKKDLIPEGFVGSLWQKVTNEDESIRKEDRFDGVPSKFQKGSLNGAKSSPSDLEELYCYRKTDYAYLKLYFYVYTADNGDIILYIDSTI